MDRVLETLAVADAVALGEVELPAGAAQQIEDSFGLGEGRRNVPVD